MTPIKNEHDPLPNRLGDDRLRVILFGEPKIFDRLGTQIDIRSRKAMALIAILASNLDQSVSRSKLAGILWDQVPDVKARKSLRQELSALSRSLPGGQSPIEASHHSLRLRHSSISTDLGDLINGQKIDPQRYSSTYLSSFDGITESLDEWLLLERPTKAAIVLKWHEDRLLALIEAGATHTEQIATARQFLAYDSAHERAWRVVIEGLIALGDMGQALRAYKACETALKIVMDAPLSPKTQQLKQQILENTHSTVRGQVIQPMPPAPSPLSERQASIAILPILELADHPRANILATGLHEGIIHVLSGIGALTVISRGSAMKFTGRRVDPQEAGRALGVQYLLTGAISGDRGRLFLYLELSEAESGRLLWTERMSIAPDALYEVEDAIIDEIVAAIAPSVRAHDLAQARRKPAASLTAYELLLQGLDNLYQLDRVKFDAAGSFLRRAVDLDPGFAAVRSHTATWHNFKVGQGWSEQPDRDLAQAAALSSEALALDHTDATALAIQGQVLSYKRRDYDQARTYFDRAIRMGPSCHLAWTLSSTTYGWVGDGPSAVAHAERAMRISPLDPFSFFTEHMLSQGHYVSGDYDKAVYWGRRAADRNGRLTSNLRTLSAALVAAGQTAEARQVVKQVRKIEPAFDLARFAERTPFVAEVRAPHIERLREAGF